MHIIWFSVLHGHVVPLRPPHRQHVPHLPRPHRPPSKVGQEGKGGRDGSCEPAITYIWLQTVCVWLHTCDYKQCVCDFRFPSLCTIIGGTACVMFIWCLNIPTWSVSLMCNCILIFIAFCKYFSPFCGSAPQIRIIFGRIRIQFLKRFLKNLFKENNECLKIIVCYGIKCYIIQVQRRAELAWTKWIRIRNTPE